MRSVITLILILITSNAHSSNFANIQGFNDSKIHNSQKQEITLNGEPYSSYSISYCEMEIDKEFRLNTKINVTETIKTDAKGNYTKIGNFEDKYYQCLAVSKKIENLRKDNYSKKQLKTLGFFAKYSFLEEHKKSSDFSVRDLTIEEVNGYLAGAFDLKVAGKGAVLADSVLVDFYIAGRRVQKNAVAIKQPNEPTYKSWKKPSPLLGEAMQPEGGRFYFLIEEKTKIKPSEVTIKVIINTRKKKIVTSTAFELTKEYYDKIKDLDRMPKVTSTIERSGMDKRNLELSILIENDHSKKVRSQVYLTHKSASRRISRAGIQTPGDNQSQTKLSIRVPKLILEANESQIMIIHRSQGKAFKEYLDIDLSK